MNHASPPHPAPSAGSGDPLLPPGARLLLIYDGYCGICTRCAEWVRAHDRNHRIALLPSQTPGLTARTGLSRAQLDRAAWVIDRPGRRFAGAAAINRTLADLGPWRGLAFLYQIPAIRPAEDALYRWFAAHRGRFSRWGVTPACERPGSHCLPPEDT